MAQRLFTCVFSRIWRGIGWAIILVTNRVRGPYNFEHVATGCHAVAGGLGQWRPPGSGEAHAAGLPGAKTLGNTALTAGAPGAYAAEYCSGPRSLAAVDRSKSCALAEPRPVFRHCRGDDPANPDRPCAQSPGRQARRRRPQTIAG